MQFHYDLFTKKMKSKKPGEHFEQQDNLLKS